MQGNTILEINRCECADNIFNIRFVRGILQFGFANVSLDCQPCNCNKDGSVENYCDTHSGQCPCKMGVEGLLCDECQDGYYDLTSEGCDGE